MLNDVKVKYYREFRIIAIFPEILDTGIEVVIEPTTRSWTSTRIRWLLAELFEASMTEVVLKSVDKFKTGLSLSFAIKNTTLV